MLVDCFLWYLMHPMIALCQSSEDLTVNETASTYSRLCTIARSGGAKAFSHVNSNTFPSTNSFTTHPLYFFYTLHLPSGNSSKS